MAYKGKYRCKNVTKYKGDASNIIYRSSWENRAMRWLDLHPDVLEWSSESVVVPYISPIDKKIHRYFVDLWFRIKKEDTVQTFLVEIKPEAQMAPPNPAKRNATPTGRVSRRYLREAATYAVNEAKWAAAEALCAKKGWKFLKWGESVIKGM